MSCEYSAYAEEDLLGTLPEPASPETAFEHVRLCYSSMLRAYARKFLWEKYRSDVEDMVQETFRALWENRRHLLEKDEEHLQRYVRKVLRATVVDYLRNRTAQKNAPRGGISSLGDMRVTDSSTIDTVDTTSIHPLHAIIAREMRLKILGVLVGNEENERYIAVVHGVFRGDKTKKVAAELGMSERTAQRIVADIKSRIVAILWNHFGIRASYPA